MKKPETSSGIFIGAGGESRTLVTSLENWDNNRYTTPAREKYYNR